MSFLALGRGGAQKTSIPGDKKTRMIDNVSTNPTVGRPKPKTTPNIEKMINQVAEKVANDFVKEMEHKDAKKKSKTAKVGKVKHTSRKKTRSNGLAFGNKKSIQSQFSRLMSELESVKKSIASPHLSKASPKPISPTPATEKKITNGLELKDRATLGNKIQNPDLSVTGKSAKVANNPALAEAVNILQGLVNPSLSSHPTKPVTESALAKAVSILEKSRNNEKGKIAGNNNNEAMFKAITILKNLNGPKLTKPTKMRNDALSLSNTKKPYNSPNLDKQNDKANDFGSGITKAIEILKDFQSPKLYDSPKETNNEDKTKIGLDQLRVDQQEEDISKSSTIPSDSEESSNVPKSPNLEGEKIRTDKMPELKTYVNSHTSDAIKSQEKESQNPSLSRARASSDDLKLQHLINTVADQAAKEVENSIKNHKDTAIRTHIALQETQMPKLEKDKSGASSASLMKSLDDVQGSKLSTIQEPKYSTVGDQQSHFQWPIHQNSPQRKRIFRLPTLSTDDNSNGDAELGPEVPSAQELRTLMKFRNKWNVKIGADKKKVNIPHNSFGKSYIACKCLVLLKISSI